MSNLNGKSFIVFESRCVIEITGFILWEYQRKSAFAFAIYNEGKIYDQNVFECKNMDSIYHIELFALAEFLLPRSLHIVKDNPNPIIVKITQQAVINGINSDLDYWAAHDWITKGGTLVKHPELWEMIYNFKKNHPVIAFQLDESRALQLQNQAKSCIAATQREIEAPQSDAEAPR
jgi:ribonuclease HI